MKIVFKILALILLSMTIVSCELLDPREWQRLKREDDMMGREYDRYTGKTSNSRPHCLVDRNGRMKECRTVPYKDRRLINCSSKYSTRGKICEYADY